MKKTIYATLVVLLTIANCHAQFQLSYGTNAMEEGNSVQQTLQQIGFIIGGQSYLPVFGKTDATLLKTDPSGNLTWSKVYGWAGDENFSSVREVNKTPSGFPEGYAAAGFTNSIGFGNSDVLFTRTDLSGTPIVSRVYGGPGNDMANCIQAINTSGGKKGFIMVGESSSFPYYPGSNVYVIETDETGNLIASTVIGDTGDQKGIWIEQTSDSGFVIAGSTTKNCSPSPVLNTDIFIIKLKANLQIQWARTIGGPANEIATCVKQIDTKTFLLTGYTESFGAGGRDVFLLSIDDLGNFQWMKTYGDQFDNQGVGLLSVISSGASPDIVVSGNTNNSTYNNDALLLKTDLYGNLLWANEYGVSGNDYGREVTPGSQNGYVFTGKEASFGAGPDDIYLVETDYNGNSGTGCERSPVFKVLKVSPCIANGAQQVYVATQKQIQLPYKEIPYAINNCYSPTPKDALLRSNNPSNKLILTIDPDQQLLTVKAPEDLEHGTFKIINLVGIQYAFRTIPEQSSFTVDLNNFPKGMYIVVAQKPGGEIVSQKIALSR